VAELAGAREAQRALESALRASVEQFEFRRPRERASLSVLDVAAASKAANKDSGNAAHKGSGNASGGGGEEKATVPGGAGYWALPRARQQALLMLQALAEDVMRRAPAPPRTKRTRRVPHPVLIGHAEDVKRRALPSLPY